MSEELFNSIPTFMHFDYTPTVEELQPNYKVKCSQSDCDSTFTNMGNYEMHLERHHKIAPVKQNKDLVRIYHCPNLNCIYHVQYKNGKNFKNIKYLRQHYYKVHLEKSHICKHCEKKFSTAGQLETHLKKNCGRKFICNVCSWEYESMEALQTHARRKGHKVIKPNHKFSSQAKRSCTGIAQTEFSFSPASTLALTYSKELDDVSTTLPCHMETQTEFPLRISPTANSNSGFLDQMLAQSTHTQTCDDLLSELGFTDIQTQTNWSAASLTAPPHENKHQYTTTATSTGFSHDELLVSTETQTSFTQCLLDSCGSNAGDLYITQHTQTCDNLLGGLFGGQESDLINGFQSTYTQT